MSTRQELQQELSRDNVGEEIISLALAAIEGDRAIEKVLAGEEKVLDDEIVETSETAPDNEEQVSPVYLLDITVSGFRGIGPETKLEFLPGPGLTVVVGRNGSGKSSFAEALEILLTGDIYRWEHNSKAGEKGLKNLHQDDGPKISARFQVVGMSGPSIVKRTWKEGSGIADSNIFAQHHGQDHSDINGIGWEKSLDRYRPILSYNELSMVESPPNLHDALAKVLSISIGDLSSANKNLRQARLNRERDEREVENDWKNNIRPVLDISEDERAVKVKEALDKDLWDLEVITSLDSEPSADHKVLRDIRNLTVPDEEQVIKVAEAIDLAYASLSKISNTKIKSAERVMGLLEAALEHYKLHDKKQPCPVCKVGLLDDRWYTNTLEQIEQLKDTTQGYREAQENFDLARDKAQNLATLPNFPDSDIVKLDRLALEWKKWSFFPKKEDEISKYFRSQYDLVRKEWDIVDKQAEEIFYEREEKWEAIFRKLKIWEDRAQKVAKEKLKRAKIEKAEDSVKSVIKTIRSRQWAHIESDAIDFWEKIRLESNVSLRSVELTGQANKRKVDLKVDVDGIEADALSVISQGELSCLALSLFFPRVRLSANPFHFMVIDDPIQSMDLARVRELARVFTEIAEERQLIVFTHDDRLSESLRILSTSHRRLDVKREQKSVVKVTEKRDPVEQSFSDVDIIMADNLPKDMKRQVIPGLCRVGIEAACVEAIWRNPDKKPHEKIKKEVLNAKTLYPKISLVLFGKVEGKERVLNEIRKQWGEALMEACENIDDGTHNTFSGDLSDLIENCKCLAQELRSYQRYNV